MKCPACDKDLTTKTVDRFEADICEGGCGGIWLDRDELFKLDEPTEFPGTMLLSIAKDPKTTVDPSRKRQCPKCPGEILVKQFLDHQNKIQMDQCWNCSGIWLDLGELQTLRSQYTTMADRTKAANEYAEKILSDNKEFLAQRTKEELQRYNAAMQNRVTAVAYEIKKIFGADGLLD